MILFRTLPLSCLPQIDNKHSHLNHLISRYVNASSNFGINLSKNSRKYACSQICSKKSHADQLFEEFEEICLHVPWDDNTWSTFIEYLFILHIPLSFAGLSIIASFFHKPTLDPQTIVISTAILQSIELGGTLYLLNYARKPKDDFYDFIFGKILLPKRNWVIKTTIGIGFLIALASLTVIIADKLSTEPNDVNDPIIKEILSQGSASQIIFFYLYCINAPVLEEIVYRGFLLSSLAAKPNIQTWKAIILSSCMFTLAHFSFENCLQLFIVGCVLGFMYCWTGTLASPIIFHSVYNAMILVNIILSIV